MKVTLDWLSAVLIVFLVATAAVAAAPRYGEDAFVRMIERQLSASAHFSIGPGVTITSPECQCTVKYLGTRIEGRHYHVDIDKLD